MADHMTASDYNQLRVNEAARESERTKRRADEDKLCMAFTEHCEEYFPRTPGKLMWTHVANQGRSAQQGDKLRKMGVYAGVHDYWFLWPHWVGVLEAKVHKRDYSPSQKTYGGFVVSMPHVKRDKFYTVQEGHGVLLSWGLFPIRPCRLFKEPCYETWEDKALAAHDFYAP